MAIQFSTALRSYMLNGGLPSTNGGNVWDTALAGSSGAPTPTTFQLYTGSPPASCAAAATGTQLASLTFPVASSPFGSSVGTAQTNMNEAVGTPVSPSNPITFVAGAGGTAGYFRVTDNSGTCHIQGTCGTPGSGADLIMSTTAIMNGQTIVITGFVFTCPGA